MSPLPLRRIGRSPAEPVKHCKTGFRILAMLTVADLTLESGHYPS